MGRCVHFTKSMKQQLISLSGTALVFWSICLAPPAHAQTTGDPTSTSWANSPYMLGDWGGERTALERSGIVFNFVSVKNRLTRNSGMARASKRASPGSIHPYSVSAYSASAPTMTTDRGNRSAAAIADVTIDLNTSSFG